MSIRVGLRHFSKTMGRPAPKPPEAKLQLLHTEPWNFGPPSVMPLQHSENWNYPDPPTLTLQHSEAWSS